MSVGPAELTVFGQLTLSGLMLAGAAITLWAVSHLSARLLGAENLLHHWRGVGILMAIALCLAFTLTSSAAPWHHRVFTAASIATATGWRLSTTPLEYELLAVIPSTLVLLGPVLVVRHWLSMVASGKWPPSAALRQTAATFVIICLVAKLLAIATSAPVAVVAATGLTGSGALPQTLIDLPRWMPEALVILQYIGPGPTGLGAGPGLYILVLLAALMLQLFRGGLPPEKQRTLALLLLCLISTASVIVGLQILLSAIAPQLPPDRRLQLIASCFTSSGWTADPIAVSGYLGGLIALTCFLGKLATLLLLGALQPPTKSPVIQTTGTAA